jgi:hypothetical protein
MFQELGKGFPVSGLSSKEVRSDGNNEVWGINRTWVPIKDGDSPRGLIPLVDVFFAVGVNQSG